MVGRRDRRHGDEGGVRHGSRIFSIATTSRQRKRSVVAIVVSCPREFRKRQSLSLATSARLSLIGYHCQAVISLPSLSAIVLGRIAIAASSIAVCSIAACSISPAAPSPAAPSLTGASPRLVRWPSPPGPRRFVHRLVHRRLMRQQLHRHAHRPHPSMGPLLAAPSLSVDSALSPSAPLLLLECRNSFAATASFAGSSFT